ncbi:MAG: 30S ribosomal protein S4 [Flavobacteriales bacterium]
MARYTGPKSKIARKFGEPIFGPDKYLEKKNYAPGHHGQDRRRSKPSEYALQLKEKQKAKYTYGILERQFSKMFRKASGKRGITGEILLQLCEARLDNIAFRAGFAPSRRAARQLVGHKHFLVNGKVTNIPSFELRPGDVIEVREKSKALETINNSLADHVGDLSWLELDREAMKATLLNLPVRDEIPETIKEQLIVELYSK